MSAPITASPTGGGPAAADAPRVSPPDHHKIGAALATEVETGDGGRVLFVAEPPAAYRRRPLLVVDTSVVAAAVFREDAHASAVALMRGRQLVAPTLLDYELASVGLRKLRRAERSIIEINGALDDYEALAILGYPIEAALVLSLATRYRLSAYETAYLWLAERLEAPLATFDARLADAAEQHLRGS